MPRSLGKHLLVELYDCGRAQLDDLEFLRTHCVAAAHEMGATVVAVHAHRFQPVGVSVVVVLAESHLALHSWPESGTACFDIFVCSRTNDPRRAMTYLARQLQAGRVAHRELKRGKRLAPSSKLRATARTR